MNHTEIIESWLEKLPRDITVFTEIMANKNFSEENRKLAAGVINYLFKSFDLIPDGIDEIGFMDDVLTLRIGASILDFGEIEKTDDDLAQKIKSLIDDIPTIKTMLGDDIFERFRKYITYLTNSSSRGRSAGEIISSPGKQTDVIKEVQTFLEEYIPPDIEKSERCLIKLKSFLDTRLPK